MKKEIEKLLEAKNAFLEINDFCTLHRWSVKYGSDSIPTDYLCAEFHFISSIDYSFPIQARDFDGIVKELSECQNAATALLGVKLKKQVENGYIEGHKTRVLEE